MNIDSIKEHALLVELNKNPRLQWLLLLVVVILSISGLKHGFDLKQQKVDEVERQTSMFSRLSAAVNKPLQQDQVERVQQAVATVIEQAPSATSASIAEASALILAEQLSAQHLTNGRSKLIGSSDRQYGSQTFWQIRIELTGQLDPKKLIGLLAHFDGSQQYRRMPTFQYRPAAGNSVSMVVDFLYRKESQ